MRPAEAAGALLLAAALALTGGNLADSARAGRAAARAVQALEQAAAAQTPEAGRPAGTLPGPAAPQQTQPPAQDSAAYLGVLRIPALALELPVWAEYTEAALRDTPCRYSGAAQTGDLVIAGHNYAAHFGKLGTLREGDLLTLTAPDGTATRYRVAAREVLPADAADEMTASGWPLTLFTCTADGRSRLTVRCRPDETTDETAEENTEETMNNAPAETPAPAHNPA